MRSAPLILTGREVTMARVPPGSSGSSHLAVLGTVGPGEGEVESGASWISSVRQGLAGSTMNSVVCAAQVL